MDQPVDLCIRISMPQILLVMTETGTKGCSSRGSLRCNTILQKMAHFQIESHDLSKYRNFLYCLKTEKFIYDLKILKLIFKSIEFRNNGFRND